MAYIFSGQTTVTTHGTEVALGSDKVNAPVMVKALAGNTGLIYLGNDGAGAVSSSTGLELAAGEAVVLDWVSDLGTLLVDSAVDGEGVCWIVLAV